MKIMENQKDIGLRIKKAREAKNLTQQQLGSRLGYSAMGISYLEQGLRKIKLEHLEKISKELNVEIGFFLEPIAPTSYPNTMWGRIGDELTEEQKGKVNKSISDFDKFVDSISEKK